MTDGVYGAGLLSGRGAGAPRASTPGDRQINAPNPNVRGFGAFLYVDGDQAIAIARAQRG